MIKKMFSVVLMALAIKTFAFCPTCTKNSLVIVLDPEAIFFFVLNYASPSSDRPGMTRVEGRSDIVTR